MLKKWTINKFYRLYSRHSSNYDDLFSFQEKAYGKDKLILEWALSKYDAPLPGIDNSPVSWHYDFVGNAISKEKLDIDILPEWDKTIMFYFTGSLLIYYYTQRFSLVKTLSEVFIKISFIKSLFVIARMIIRMKIYLFKIEVQNFLDWVAHLLFVAD